LPLERLNAVLVITPQKQYLEEAQRWLSRLDRGSSDGGAQLYVYYVKNVKAVDLGDNLSEIFTGSRSSSSKSSSSTSGSVVPGLQSVEISTTGSANSKRAEERRARDEKARSESNAGIVTPPNYSGSPGAPSGDGIAIVESDDIRITAIEESNALLVRATPGQYEAILQAIKRLDVVPLQVHIEVQILQVDLTNNLNLGVQWFFENALQNRTDPTSGRPLTPPGYRTWLSFAGTASGSTGLGWTFVNQTAASIINTLQSESRVTVISAPSLLVLNNKEASINVGRQIPVNSIIYNPLSTGGVDPSVGNINQSYVQFRDTGTILSVTPRVNPGGLVFLEIKQEQSSPGDSADAIGGNVPVNKRTIETEIAVQSGDTVLLGGLISETVDQGKGGVPGLTKIPLLGRLFGSSKNNVSRAELLVLIKPTVIENASQAKDLTEDYRERFRGLKPLLKKSEDVLN
jgi:general secretion pathway protein D